MTTDLDRLFWADNPDTTVVTALDGAFAAWNAGAGRQFARVPPIEPRASIDEIADWPQGRG